MAEIKCSLQNLSLTWSKNKTSQVSVLVILDNLIVLWSIYINLESWWDSCLVVLPHINRKGREKPYFCVWASGALATSLLARCSGTQFTGSETPNSGHKQWFIAKSFWTSLDFTTSLWNDPNFYCLWSSLRGRKRKKWLWQPSGHKIGRQSSARAPGGHLGARTNSVCCCQIRAERAWLLVAGAHTARVWHGLVMGGFQDLPPRLVTNWKGAKL